MTVEQIIILCVIVLLVILYPILVSSRNKKESQRLQEQTNSLKRGDKVLTTSGVYGTIVDLHLENDKKVVTIETGTGKQKGYLAVDAYAIYSVFKEEEKTSHPVANEAAKSVEQPDNDVKTEKAKTSNNDEQAKETKK